ncbi:MAG: UvrD-helicase domain-containing protein [Bacillales bacterium]|nr:UvrD-helicase domain-containing protein [Bacillales bacterium]
MGNIEESNIFDIEKFIFNKNYSISASAGTGKTFSIVNIVKKLREYGIKEDELLIVTYTEKAAGELKDRIKKDVKGFNIDASHIGTIHSFCKDTISEFYLTMGLPFSTTVVDDTKMKDLSSRLIRDYFYNKRIDFSSDIGNIEKIVNLIYLDSNENLNEEIVSLIDPIMRLNIAVSTLIGKSEKEVLDFFINYNDPNDLKLSEEIREVFSIFDKESETYLRKMEMNKNDKKYFEQVDQLWNSLYEYISSEGIINYSITGRKVKDLKNFIDSLKKEDSIESLEEISLELYKKWQEEKSHYKWCSFSDMLREVREAIYNGSGLKEKLRKKYKYALIDEFQDTNQLQWDIFKAIFLDTNDNHIIVVGDRKQSIYSFQGADLTVYDSAVKSIIEKGGLSMILPNNYRSSKAVISGYNKLFQMDSYQSLDYVNQVGVGLDKLDAKFDGQSIKGIKVVASRTKDTNDIIPITPFDYAGAIVKMITEYCSFNDEGKTRLQVYDKDGESRNVSFKDFMILARTRSEFYSIEYELKHSGIPYVKYNDSKLFNGIECSHWIALLNAILQPDFTGRNRNAFRKALFTKFFGKSLKEISSPYYDTDSSKEMELILKWKDLANSYRFIELINSILTDSKIEQRMTSLNDIQSLSVFKQIGDYSLDYLLAGNSLVELKNNLSTLNKGDSDGDNEDKKTTVAKGTDFDCVDLMTMHASKGLDRAIVFIVGGEKGFPKSVSKVGIYHKELETENGKITKSFITMDDKDYKSEKSVELDRLFYVANTRPRYLLVLPYYKENKDISVVNSVKQFISMEENKSLYDLVLFNEKDLDFEKIKKDIKKIIQKNASIDNYVEEEKITQLNILKNIADNMNKHSLFKHSYASMSKIKEESNDIIDGNLNYNKEGNLLEEVLYGFDKSSLSANMNYSDIKPSIIPDQFPKGALIGTTLHEVFENFEFTDIDKEDNHLSSLIQTRFKVNNIPDNPVFEEYVVNMVKDVLNAIFPVIKGCNIDINNTFKLKEIDSKNKKAEAEFNFALEEIQLSNYCNGFIDLLFKRGDYYCILDWKSDTLNDDDLLSYNNLNDLKKRVDGHYSIQRVLYAYTLVNYLYNCKLEPTLEEVFDKHFGGIFYVFIRGCKKDTPNGIYAQTWNSYSDLKKEFDGIMKVVLRGGIKGGKLDE